MMTSAFWASSDGWLVLEDDNRQPSAWLRISDIVAIERTDAEPVDGHIQVTTYLRGKPSTFFEGWLPASLFSDQAV